MKLIFAAAVVFAGVLGAVLLLGGPIEQASHVQILAVAFGLSILFLLLCWGVLSLFNPPTLTVQQMEEQGLLIPEYYRAVRALEVEEFEDEGPHYFIELENGSLLYLNGQYLYDYGEDPEMNQPRQFPCTDFVLRRHRDEGHVVDIVCRGNAFEPEITVPAEGIDVSLFGQPLANGDFITNKTFDALKAELAL